MYLKTAVMDVSLFAMSTKELSTPHQEMLVPPQPTALEGGTYTSQPKFPVNELLYVIK